MDRYGIEIESCGKKYTRVLKATRDARIVSGYFKNAAKKDPQDTMAAK